MYTITKEYHFSASHRLFGLAEDHPCSRLHGHNYVVEVELQSERLNDAGFVRDYHELDTLKTYIDDKIDHRHLNDIFGDDGTTAEKLAKHFYDWCKEKWPEVSAVRVKETPKTCAVYSPQSPSSRA
jgi:6-pyruvoyltetrahydropterin/6-carboxytetrahydropterin synthase